MFVGSLINFGTIEFEVGGGPGGGRGVRTVRAGRLREIRRLLEVGVLQSLPPAAKVYAVFEQRGATREGGELYYPFWSISYSTSLASSLPASACLQV